MAISFVGAAEWSESTDDTSYTLTKPTGVASGDFMLAILGLDLYSSSGSETTVTAPTGWTLVKSTYASPNHQMVIMRRTAGSSEPGSWNGTLSGSRGPKASIVVAYRGVAAIAVSDDNTSGAVTSMGTGTISNPSSTNWRVLLGSYSSVSVSYALSSNEVTKREGKSHTSVEVGAWDSNGTVSSGNTSRTMSRGAIWESAATWLGILDAIDGANVDGTLSASVKLPTVSASGTLSYSGTLDMTVPVGPQMTASGIATPPDGPLSVTVTPVMSVTAATAAAGTVSIDAGPIVNIVAETRFFGVRVVTPEAESRVVKPKLGPAD